MEFKKLKRFTFVFGCCISSSKALEDPKPPVATENAEEWPEEVLGYKRPTIKATFDPEESKPRIDCRTDLDVKSRRICGHVQISSMLSTLLHFLLYKEAFMPRFVYALERFWSYSAIESIKAKVPEEQLPEIMSMAKAIFTDESIAGHTSDRIKKGFTMSTQRGPNGEENMGGLFMHGISSGLSNLLGYSNTTALFFAILLVFLAPNVIGAICSYFEDALNDMAKYYLQSKGVFEVEEVVHKSVNEEEEPPSEEYLDLVKALEHLLFQQFRAPLSVIRMITFPFRVMQKIFSYLYNLLYYPAACLYIACYFLLVYVVAPILNVYIEEFQKIIRTVFGDFFTTPPSYYETVSHVVGDEAYKKLMRKSAAFYIQVSSSELVSAFQFLGKQIVEREQNANFQSAEFYRILSYIAYIYPLLGWQNSVHDIEIKPLLQIVIAIISIGVLYSNYNKISQQTRDIMEAIALDQARAHNDVTEVLGMSYMAIPYYECERYAAFKEESDRKKLQLAIAQQKMDNYLTFFKFGFTSLSMLTILLTQDGVFRDAYRLISNWNRFFNKLNPNSFLDSFVRNEDKTDLDARKAMFTGELTELLNQMQTPKELDEIKKWGGEGLNSIRSDDNSKLMVMKEVSEKGYMWQRSGIGDAETMVKAIKTAFSGGKVDATNLIEKIANGWHCNQLNQDIKDSNKKIGTVIYMLVLFGGMFYVYSSLTDALASKLELEQRAQTLASKIVGHHRLVSCPSSECPTGKTLNSYAGNVWAIMPEGFTYKPIEGLRDPVAEALSTEDVEQALKEAVNFTQKIGGVAESIKIELSEPEKIELSEPELTEEGLTEEELT